jgi:hypothetical protein
MSYTPNDYGEMTVVDNTTETTISSQNTWTKISQFAQGNLDGVSFSSSELSVSQSGTYLASIAGSLSPATTAVSFEVAVAKNGSPVSKSKLPKRVGDNQDQTISIGGVLLDLQPSDNISVIIRNLNNTSNVTVTDANFTLVQQ